MMKKLFVAILLSLCAFGASAQYVGGVNFGQFYARDGSVTSPSYAFNSSRTLGWWLVDAGTVGLAVGGADSFRLGTTSGQSFVQFNRPSGTSLYNEAAHTLALRSTTNAQAFRIYNTFTDAANYERGVLYYSGTNLRLETQRAGTGGNTSLILGTDSSARLTLAAGQNSVQFTAFTFANIAAHLTANGSIGYCSDCTIANPCAGAGTGAFAKRLNGVNVCN